MFFTILLASLIGQVPEVKTTKDAPKASKVIVVDEENDGLPGLRVGPTRKELEELIRDFGRDPVSEDLVDRLDGLFRPRWTAQRRFDDARRRIHDPEFVEMIDTAAIEATGKPADTRAFFYRAAIEYDTVDMETMKNSVREDIDREKTPRKIIRGKVVDDRNGKPIEGAVVASISGMMTRTDSHGNYVLKTRPPKSTNPMGVTVEAPGYALTQTYYAWNEIADDVTTDHRMVQAIPFGGQVVDPAGKPIVGATLDLWIQNEAICRDGSMQKVNFNTVVTFRAKSGPDGIYAFRYMPPDLPDRQAASSLTASHPEYESRTKNYAPNEELGTGWQITLTPGCEVTGVVVDESGKPIKDVNVRVYSNLGTTTNPAVVTKSDGRFRFAGLPVGNTRIIAQPRGMPFVTENVTTNSHKSTEVKITVEPGAYLTGKVIGTDGKPVKNARVGWLQALEADGKPNRNEGAVNRFSRTNDEGTFKVGPVRKGKYKITAHVDDPNVVLSGSADAETGGKDAVIEIKPQANVLFDPVQRR